VLEVINPFGLRNNLEIIDLNELIAF
jgi:hypothetical protein